MRTKIRNRLKGQFASVFEKVIWDDAKSRKIEITYEPVSFEYNKRAARGSKCGDCASGKILVPGKYTPDFCINGRIYVEAKGYLDSKKRSLMEDFVKNRPDVDLRFIFKQNNWLTRNKKTRYSDWADKLGIKWVIGEKVPEEWLTT